MICICWNRGVTCTLWKMSLSHMLFFLMMPSWTSAYFLSTAKFRSHFLKGVLAPLWTWIQKKKTKEEGGIFELMFKAEKGGWDRNVVSTNFVIDTVEKPRNDWENGGLQGFHVIWQQPDVTLEESHLTPSTIHHCLQDQTDKKTNIKGCSKVSFTQPEDCKHTFMIWSSSHLDDSLKHVS